MASLLYLILGTICILMFFVDLNKKYMLLFVNYICFSFITLPSVPFGNSVFIVPICFFLSELKNVKKDCHCLSPYIKMILVIMIIATIVLQINSPHYNDSVFNTIRLIISELITKYFVIAYAFISIKSLNDLSRSINYIYYALIVLTFFGLLNFMTKDAVLLDSLGLDYSIGDRFRVYAMFANPFCYGYMCILLSFYMTLFRSKNILSKYRYYLSLFCCAFGVISCGSRSVLLTGVLSYVFYILLTKSMSRKLYIFFVITMLGILSYNFIPSVSEKIDHTLTIFTDSSGSNVQGSSIDMRETQYLTTLLYIKDDFLFGKGLDFFNIDLGWQDIENYRNNAASGLAGLEGVVMKLLLERGFVGLLFYLIFYISLVIKFIKYRNYDNETSFIGLSILIAYILFANSNGELSSDKSTLLVCGALLHILATQKRSFLEKTNKIPNS